MKCVESALSETFQMEDTESVFVDMVPTLLLAETEVKQENGTTDDPLEISVKKEGSDCWNLESKIEIEADMILKTESSDLTELIQEINKEDTKDNQVNTEDEVMVALSEEERH